MKKERKKSEKGERESHWEGWEMKKEGKGNKQREPEPLRNQERKSKRTKTFAQIVLLLTYI